LFWGAGGSPAWGNVWDLGVASGPGGSRVAGMQAGRLRSRVRVIPLGALPRVAFAPPAWGNARGLGVASGPGGSRVAGMQAGRLRSRVRVTPLGALPRVVFSPSRATTCRHGLEGACFGARAARPHGIAPGVWVWHRSPVVPALRECRRAACAPGSALFHLEHYPVWHLPPSGARQPTKKPRCQWHRGCW
jgi:hypothetical protein